MKLIIEISQDVYTRLFDSGIQDNEIAVDDVCEMARALRMGTSLYSDSEQDEVQAYYAGMSYGWEQGRKSLIEDAKAEIEANMYCDKDTRRVKNANASGLKVALDILDNIGKAESEDKEDA